MPTARAHSLADAFLNRPDSFATMEEGNVLLPREPNHDEQSVSLRGIEEPARRYRVHAYGVDAVLAHQVKIALDILLPVLLAITTRAEGAVGDAPNVELVVTCGEELSGGGGSSCER